MKRDLKKTTFIEFELNEIIRKIFFPLKNAVADFEYLHSFNKGEYFLPLRKYNPSITRMQFYVGVFIIININKLYNKNEDKSLTGHLEEMKLVHKDSEWKEKILLKDINGYLKNIKSNDTRVLFRRVLKTRNKFHAHLDRDNVEIDFSKIQIGLKEMNLFIDLAESIIKDLELKLFGRDTSFCDSKSELGNVYIEDLIEFARLKYELSTPTNRKHDRIQMEIVSACRDIGIEAIQEYRGQDWRADVFVPNNGKPIAFEIQLSPQSLRKTLERQSKYIRDGIIGCWLFENPITKLNEERPDLPVFYVEDKKDSNLLVNLGNRRKVELHTFLENFISNNIQFKSVAKTKTKQLVNLVFYEMECWKCHEMNHLFYVDTSFYSACNAEIQPNEALWESNSMEYRPEIIELAQKFVESRIDLDLKLGQIKKRYSKTLEDSYTSFGCYKCDSIFGDYFVMEAKIDIMYSPKELTYQGEIELKESILLPIPHWCFPDNKQYCDNK